MITLPPMPERPVSALEKPLNARTVAARLGIGLSTLNSWLSAEEERPPAERRFNFHAFHGRKRLWSEANFRALERAIEAESEPGGRLAGWRTGSGSRSRSDREAAAATNAMLAVLGFRYDEDDEDGQPVATEVEQCPRR